MQTIYKNHRIETVTNPKSTSYDVFSRSLVDPATGRQAGPLHLVAGFIMEEFAEQVAINRAKDLIDANFDTPMIAKLRAIPRWT